MMLGAAFVIVTSSGFAGAADTPPDSEKGPPGIVNKFEEAGRNVGKRVEEAVTGTVKKFEDQRVAERLADNIKKAAEKTGEEFERTGKRIQEKFSK
jgi:hypothetical protein